MLGRAFLCRTRHFCVKPGFFCVEPCILLSNRAFLCRTSVIMRISIYWRLRCHPLHVQPYIIHTSRIQCSYCNCISRHRKGSLKLKTNCNINTISFGVDITISLHGDVLTSFDYMVDLSSVGVNDWSNGRLLQMSVFSSCLSPSASPEGDNCGACPHAICCCCDYIHSAVIAGCWMSTSAGDNW